MVVPDSHRVSRAPRYSGTPSSKLGSCRLQGCHLLWPAFPDHSTKILICNLPTAPYHRQTEPYNTTATTHTGLTSLWFRLFPFRSPLLGESRLISFPAGTEMFQFPAFASQDLCIQSRDTGLCQWVSPFGHLRIKVWLPTPRSFSQAPTSFIASSCQGIHRMRLFA